VWYICALKIRENEEINEIMDGTGTYQRNKIIRYAEKKKNGGVK
jgi:hypothetical protein